MENHKVDLVNPNPISILQRISVFVFGKNKPDKITRFFFFLNLVAWSLFFFWTVLSYLSLEFIENINEANNLHIVIEKRGIELGISDLYTQFKTCMFYMIFIWIAVFFGLILLWRKKTAYFFFYFGGLIVIPIIYWWFLNLQYMIEDISFFDKILYGLMFLPMVIYHLFFMKERDSIESINNEIKSSPEL